MERFICLVFYFCFWAALTGFFFIGLGAKTGDTDLMLFGLPYAFLGTLLAIVTLKISNTFKGLS